MNYSPVLCVNSLLKQAYEFYLRPDRLELIISDMQQVSAIDRKKSQIILERYVELLIDSIRDLNLGKDNWELEFNQFYIPLSRIRHRAGRYGPQGQQKYWSDWFLANHSFILIDRLGYHYKNRARPTVAKIKG
jgi:hypothetical protein